MAVHYIQAPEPEWIDSSERMLQVCREIEDTGICGIDTETTGKDAIMKDYVLFWSLAPSLKKRYCLSRDMLQILYKELGKNPHIQWPMTNANFDNCMLANSGVPLLAGQIHCTLIMDALYDENRTGRHGLKETAIDHCNLNMRGFKKVFKKLKGETYQDTLMRMMRDKPDEAIDYASLDAWATLKVFYFLKKQLQNESTYNGLTLWDYYDNLERPYIKVLYENIRNGIMVDEGWLRECAGPINEQLGKLHRQINRAAGFELNPKSTAQLIDLFINKRGHEVIKWTSGGESGNRSPCMDINVIKSYAYKGDEVAQTLIKYRSLEKVRGTYIDGMIKRLSTDRRIHTMIKQHVAVTGRLSSSNPNLHNLPRPDEDIWQIRGAFMPRHGHTLVAIDYRQLEMRLMAHLSGDKQMRDVIRRGWDVHMGTASIMYDEPYEDIAAAKKASKPLEDAKVPKTKWPNEMRRLLGFRQTAKSMGFAQHEGELKPAQNWGNLSATA